MQPALGFAEDFGLVGADFLVQFAECGLARRLAGVDPALRHLPGGEPGRHIDAAADKHLCRRVQQHDADRRLDKTRNSLSERVTAAVARSRRAGGCAQFTTRPLNSEMPRSMSTARAS